MLILNQMIGMGDGATASSPPAISFRSSYGDTANATTYTFVGCDLGPPDPTREIFITVEWYSGGVAVRSLNSVTIGGVTATLEAGANNSAGSAVRCAWAAVPSGATGDIALTFSGAAGNCNIAVYSVINRATYGSGATDSGSQIKTGTTLGVTGIDVADGGFVLSAIGWSNFVGYPAMRGLSAVTDITFYAENTGYSAHGSTPMQAGASSNSPITWTWTTSRSGLAAAWAF